ncbi:MAG: hypothetical protein JW749_07480 [Sedimentisphaerales bacterium]|nr:hypothetical protein [Sedimentisphaerales bacterium]
MRKALLIIVFLALLALAVFPQNAGSAQSGYDKNTLDADKAKGDQIAKKISSIEVLAPLAPVALSPFFGITCLSGASILSSKGVLPENSFITDNKALNNPLVFIVFLALSIATSLPKITAVSKGFAEAADQLETYAGIISYLAIFYLGTVGAEPATTASTQQVIYTAGILTFTNNTLLMLASVINIIVINTVKFFFELLVWISPIPALDAIFESTNKVVTAALVAIYAFSPYLAMVINIILFLICLSIFKWVRRRVIYYRTLYLGPIIAKILGRTDFSPPGHIKARIAAVVEQGSPILKVFPASKIQKIKKKEMAWLTAGKDALFLVKLRLLRQPKVAKIDTANAQIEIITGLLSNTIAINSEQLPKPVNLTFSRVYNRQKNVIAAALKPFGLVRAESPPDSARAPGTAPQPGLA